MSSKARIGEVPKSGTMMNALVMVKPGILDYRQIALQAPRGDDVIVRVAACGICGSDMHRWHGHSPAPSVMGHEAAGWIESGPRAGERVVINPTVSCMRCDFCLSGRHHLCRQRQNIGLEPRWGAFADFLYVPERNLIPVPDHLDLAIAALCEPVAVAYHGVELGSSLLSKPLAAARALVLGGGAIGLLSALILAMRGVKCVLLAEPNPLRRATAQKSGIANTYAPGEANEPEAGSIDLVIDAVGAVSTRAASSRLVKAGGAIVHLGLLPGSEGLDVRRITLDEIVFCGSFAYTPGDFLESLRILADERLGALSWVESRPMSVGAQAFLDIDADRAVSAKIVLRN
jgi:threonine dehydrogenase-like Zn-dependent dehydrogenase